MYHFFVEETAVEGGRIRLTGGDVKHIKNVLRLKAGDRITVSDNSGKEYLCVICQLTNEAVFVKIEDMQGTASELPVEIWLFQGFPKGDKMDTIIQKTVELGVAKVVPVIMERSIVKLDKEKARKKQERFQAVSLAAAKQSKRGVIPEILPVVDFHTAVEMASALDMVMIPYESADDSTDSKKVIKSIRHHNTAGIFIGPEGGFEKEEVKAVRKIGGEIISLGHRILRTETAGMAVMSIIMFELECR